MNVMDAVAPMSVEDVDRSMVEYGVDSLRAMELVVSLEEAFGVSIPDDCVATMRTLEQVTALVIAKLEER